VQKKYYKLQRNVKHRSSTTYARTWLRSQRYMKIPTSGFTGLGSKENELVTELTQNQNCCLEITNNLKGTTNDK
jgi:hypothetical protein